MTFESKAAMCPICKASPGLPCTDLNGRPMVTHVERARVSRWAQMGAAQ